MRHGNGLPRNDQPTEERSPYRAEPASYSRSGPRARDGTR